MKKGEQGKGGAWNLELDSERFIDSEEKKDKKREKSKIIEPQRWTL